MQWIRIHPYASALCVAGIMVVVGIFIVQWRTAVPVTNTSTWSGAGFEIPDPTSYGPIQNTGTSKEEDIIRQAQSGSPYTYIPPALVSNSGTGTETSGPFDINDFIAMLLRDSSYKPAKTIDDSSLLADAYSFIPNGLISTTTPQKTLTNTQQTLYSYGNDIGSYIQSFEEQYLGAAATILKDQAEDRTDPQKAAAVEDLARAMQELGQTLLSIENVPPEIASAHAALAKSYIAIGTNLALVPKAKSDDDFLKAIETYNASADTFTSNYVSMTTFLGAHAVTFNPRDAGSVFTFTQAGF